MPEVVAAPRRRTGSGFWVAAGLCTLVASWPVLSVVPFVLALFRQSGVLGGLSAAAVLAGGALLAYAVLLEVQAYRSLGTVERLRAVCWPRTPPRRRACRGGCLAVPDWNNRSRPDRG